MGQPSCVRRPCPRGRRSEARRRREPTAERKRGHGSRTTPTKASPAWRTKLSIVMHKWNGLRSRVCSSHASVTSALSWLQAPPLPRRNAAARGQRVVRPRPPPPGPYLERVQDHKHGAREHALVEIGVVEHHRERILQRSTQREDRSLRRPHNSRKKSQNGCRAADRIPGG